MNDQRPSKPLVEVVDFNRSPYNNSYTVDSAYKHPTNVTKIDVHFGNGAMLPKDFERLADLPDKIQDFAMATISKEQDANIQDRRSVIKVEADGQRYFHYRTILAQILSFIIVVVALALAGYSMYIDHEYIGTGLFLIIAGIVTVMITGKASENPSSKPSNEDDKDD